jgi:DNA-binding NarL/FixJ family response regulator
MHRAEQGRASRIVVADDHPLFREALARIVNSYSELEVIAEAEDGQQALELCRRLRPDLALLDIKMPKMGGIEATRKLKQEVPSLAVLLITALEEPNHLLEALKAGASGYVLKDASAQEITKAIREVLEGESPLDHEVAMQLFTRLIDEKQQQAPEDLASTERPSEERSKLPPPVEPLTPRELELLRLMRRGQTNQQIAQNLSISTSTVKNHVHNIIKKLGASDRVQAVTVAIEHGLVAMWAIEFLELGQIVDVL